MPLLEGMAGCRYHRDGDVFVFTLQKLPVPYLYALGLYSISSVGHQRLSFQSGSHIPKIRGQKKKKKKK